MVSELYENYVILLVAKKTLCVSVILLHTT